ncbi:MAG: hypothetical protein KF745_05945 [Phycisphaeraceae bacterium]|nr:hypothetical protein [Phycisphaeraceae bacterium]
MSHAATPKAGAHPAGADPIRVDQSLVTMGGGSLWFPGLMIVGVVSLLVVGFAAAAGGATLKHAIASYHIGAVFAIGLALGSLGMVMIFQQTNAGWIATCRRTFETVASLMPVALVLFLPVVVATIMVPGWLFKWMSPSNYDSQGHIIDSVLAAKAAYLNKPFFYIRLVAYFAVWISLGTALYTWSRRQDTTGDKSLTVRSRFVSSFGLLLFALTTAFAAFDWLMSLDYHWFSTMFGVCFFAGNILSSVCVVVIVLTVLRAAGKLKGIVTDEHFHDLGKLMLAFMIFWAYVTFSQYFLIWYSNIPEETGWFVLRREGSWMTVAKGLALLHFGVPFLVLLWRRTKRSPMLLSAVAVLLLFMHFVDLFYIVRPTLSGVGPFQSWWIDLFGWLGPTAIFLAFVARKVAANPLIPLKDPRLGESLHHKNYV